MKVFEYLDKVANKVMSDIPNDDGVIYVSKFDGSYITRVGMEDSIKFLIDRGITDELRHGTGFSPEENKWYGWSHRAIFGFTIGSTCKKGDCHYKANTPEGLIEDHANFYSDIDKESVDSHRAECQILKDRSGIRVNDSYEIKCGKGIWIAKTMGDAKQMAIDFNESVS